jgi:translation initiation factor 2 alpha subunit (eIF-2alpha)
MELEVGDVVLCTVEKIEKTNIFVKIEGDGEGNIVINEIAPGRIRNLRDYVVPKKKIVCKVIRMGNNRIDLSLRRVTTKEQKEVMEEFKKEKSYISVLKSVLGEKSEEVIKEILEKERLFDFLENAKDNPKELGEIAGKTDAKKILEIIKTEKRKNITVKKELGIKTTDSNGLELIKELFKDVNNIEVKYISGGKYSLKIESENPKEADKKLDAVLQRIKSETKGKNFEVNIKEK